MSQNSLDFDVVPESSHPRVRAFHDLWAIKCRGQELPSRSDFEVEELAPWFGHVLIMDVIDGGRDFRYRMIGTRITEFLKRDYTGNLVSESDYGRGKSKVFDTFRRPLIERRPVFRSGHVVWAADKTWRSYDSVHCPLRRDSEETELTIGVLYFGEIAVPDPGPDGVRRF